MNPYLLCVTIVSLAAACYLAGYTRGMKSMEPYYYALLGHVKDSLRLMRDLLVDDEEERKEFDETLERMDRRDAERAPKAGT